MGHSFSVFSIVSSAGLVVKLVLLILLFFSITSWAIIFLKFFSMRKAEKETETFGQTFWKSKNISEAYSNTKNLSNTPVARVFRIGYSELRRFDNITGVHPGGKISRDSSRAAVTIRRKLKNGVSEEMKRLVKTVPFLATVGNTAPFIGLFGTVWGIMDSFHGIGMSKSVSLAVVAPGISEALVATAFGLGVAIPSVIAFNYFSNKLDSLNTSLESFSADFLNLIEYEVFRSGNN
ncbi:MAG: protein TolQ [Desulforegulaceae bacterium]|nr:protein TolQ [Desulforegulaceae bacterium]